MILVDTSVWIDHLHAADAALARQLEVDQVVTHPFVIAELAAGSLARRGAVIAALSGLRRLPMAAHAEVMALIKANRLGGRGLGVVDLHLLAACRLSPGVRLWTRDERLSAAAGGLGLPVWPSGG
jgi:predicted nucleic acid-binding protein